MASDHHHQQQPAIVDMLRLIVVIGVIIVSIADLQLSLAGENEKKISESTMESVPDVEKSMYLLLDGFPCVRLLNLSAQIGCANPSRDMVYAPLRSFNPTSDTTPRPSTLVVSMDHLQSFFQALSQHDGIFASNVVGVLVLTSPKMTSPSFSPADKFPQSIFAPYASRNYPWNPTGSGVMLNAFNFPIFLITDTTTSATLHQMAINNERNALSHTLHIAEFNMVMQTTKSGTHDSESCLREDTCLPLGGYRYVTRHYSYSALLFGGMKWSTIWSNRTVSCFLFMEGSVWSSLPPINISSTAPSKPIILAVASMDSASFFRDKSLGAESPISGLISLLAAVDALSRMDGLNGLSKQLVFLVCTGESWGYLGSRRFLHELDLQSDGVRGLNGSLIEMVMEVGSVGKGFSKGATTFFAHTAGESSARNKMLSALERVQDSLKSEHVQVSSASTSNPGIPPSSLMSFLKKNPQTSGMVIEDFDTVYSNTFYNSHLDDLSNINSSAIVAAASLVARSLYTLAASESTELSASSLSRISVNPSLVEELLSCLLSCDPGMGCGLVEKYISARKRCPSHYVGVILGEPSSSPYLGYVEDSSRFVWNFLADKTSLPSKNGSSSVCSKGCGDGEVCIKAEIEGKGVCVTSTTRYVAAYSTRLKYESEKWSVLAGNTSSDLVDPVWTESNWKELEVRVYRVESASYDRALLLGGVGITAVAYLVIVTTRAYINKTLKRD